MINLFDIKKCSDGEYRVIMALTADNSATTSIKVNKNKLYILYNELREIFKDN